LKEIEKEWDFVEVDMEYEEEENPEDFLLSE
jgi:hypothetical protein